MLSIQAKYDLLVFFERLGVGPEVFCEVVLWMSLFTFRDLAGMCR